MNKKQKQPLKINLSSIDSHQLIGNLGLFLAVAALIFSVFTSVNYLLKLNDLPKDVPTTTLLNQGKIQDATTLLQEQTINFIIE